MGRPQPAIKPEAGGAFLASVPGCILVPEAFGSDAGLMIDTAKQFVRREVMPVLDALDKQEEGLMPALMKKASDLGFSGPETPEQYGGLGLSKSLSARILEMLSPNGSFSTTIGVHTGIAQGPIALFGTEEQKRNYLPRLASGEWMGAYALSETNSGSDALSLSTKAIPSDDGSEYLLTGTKMWTSNAKWADLFIVFAKVRGERMTAFLIERGFPGVSIGKEEHKLGLKGSSTARLVLEAARVPAANMLYREGEGHKVALNALNLGRFKLAAMALGQAREAIHQSAKYAKDRKQFGLPISNFGLIRDKLARCGSTFFAAESMVYRTGGLIDTAFEAVNPEAPDVAEQNQKAAEAYALECSACKVFATEVLDFCADEAIQIHGGYGYTEEFPVARLWRDARVTRIYEGTNEINRLFVFERIVKKGLLDALCRAKPQSYVHALLIEAASAATDGLGAGLTRDQQLSAALSDLVITLYAQQSAHSRAVRAKKEGHPAAAFAEAAASAFTVLSDLIAAARAAEAFARCGCGKTVSIPPPDPSYTEAKEAVAEAVLSSVGYPLG